MLGRCFQESAGKGDCLSWTGSWEYGWQLKSESGGKPRSPNASRNSSASRDFEALRLSNLLHEAPLGAKNLVRVIA
jgi:hypothetical protein